MRRFDNEEIIVAAPRWYAKLTSDDDRLPLNHAVWEDTVLILPENYNRQTYRNILTNEPIKTLQPEEKTFIKAADVFKNFCVAMLIHE
jgi:maltooligosyltrehalose synthase